MCPSFPRMLSAFWTSSKCASTSTYLHPLHLSDQFFLGSIHKAFLTESSPCPPIPRRLLTLKLHRNPTLTHFVHYFKNLSGIHCVSLRYTVYLDSCSYITLIILSPRFNPSYPSSLTPGPVHPHPQRNSSNSAISLCPSLTSAPFTPHQLPSMSSLFFQTRLITISLILKELNPFRPLALPSPENESTP